MKKLLFQSGVLLLLLALMSTGHAQKVGEEVFEVNRFNFVYCDQGQSIQHAVDRATSGTTAGSTVVMLVFGTCEESVLIRRGNMNILGRDAEGTVFGDEATIISPDGEGTPAFRVENAENVFIAHFNISGETAGVEIAHGSSAWIQDNQISGGATGVHIGQGSSARVIDNEINESTDLGILINGASYGEISGNVLNSTIDEVDSDLSQIFVAGSAAADIWNNTINASSGSGILVVATSSAVINGNNVSVPAGVGMFVGSNSNIAFFAPNTVSGAASIICGVSGSLFVGAVQTITAGAVTVNAGCDLNNDVGDLSFPP